MICTDKICHATIPNVDACIKVIRQGQIDIHGVFIYPTSADPKLIHFIDLIDSNIQSGACLNVLELVKITPSQIVALLRKHDDIIHGEFAVGHNLYRAVFAIVLFECFPGAVELLAILDFDINEVVGILLDKYEVERCYYGHLHGYTHRRAFEGMREKTEYALIAADYVAFQPVKICN